MSEQQAGVDPAYLSKVSAARFEALTFMNLHPEYFSTPANGKVMTDYMAQEKLILTAENFEYAFEKLKAQGKILPAKEALATMSDAESQQFYRDHGTPVYDGHGRITGYNLPEIYRTESTASYNRPRFTQSTLPAHPEDAKRNPSKREFAMWNADRQRDWLIERGYWGKDLPGFLR